MGMSSSFIMDDSIKVEDLKGYFHDGRKYNKTVQKTVPNVINKVIAESHRQGVDPYASLAQTWNESMFGTADRPGMIDPKRPDLKQHKVFNPMQYNAKDLAPPSQTNDKRQLQSWSQDIWNSIIEKNLKRDPNWVDATHERYPESNDEQNFQKARRNAIAVPIKQDLYIQGGVNYLRKMIDKNPNDLPGAFKQYRGTGSEAEKSGKHVKELFDTLQKDKKIRELVDTQRIGA
jgi:hypothetical protein